MPDREREIDAAGSRLPEARAGSAHASHSGHGPLHGEPEFAGPGPAQVIWQGRWIVLGVLLLALACGLGYLLRATPIYESTSRIYVEKEGPTIISGDEGMVMTRSRNYLHTQAELFKSFDVLLMALEKLGAANLRSLAGVDHPAAFLKEMLIVSVGKVDEILSISVRSPYPLEAAQIVNAVVEAYHDYHSQKKQTTAAQVLQILRSEKQERDQELSDRLKGLVDFKKQAGVLLFESEQENLNIRRVASRWDALDAARLEALDARIALESFRNTMGNSLTQKELLPPGLQAQLLTKEQEYRSTRQVLRRELLIAEEELLRLRSELTEECPSVRATRSLTERICKEIAELDERWERESHEVGLLAAEHRASTANQKLEALEQAVQEDSKEAAEAMVKQAEYRVLESGVKRAESLCDLLDDRIKEINVTEDTGALNISILDVAKPGDSPVEPHKTRTMALALVLGLLLGAGLAFLRDWLDHRLRSSEEMARVLDAPVLGVLPHFKDFKDISRAGQRVHDEPSSFTAEAYRSVRTAVYFNAESREAKTLIITSPMSGDGKSTVTSNLAIAMAQVGQRILIIDCDFRRPTQHKIFGFEQGAEDVPDIVDVLEGRAPADRLILPSGIQHLDVAPCLTMISHPGEIINKPEFAKLLKELSQRYDRVLVDSPPVMPVADARVLGALCDAVIVVLRAERSGRKATELTREGLESVGAHILGTVVNDVPKSKGGHGHYGYYGVSKYYRYDTYGTDGDREGRQSRRAETRTGKGIAGGGVGPGAHANEGEPESEAS